MNIVALVFAWIVTILTGLLGLHLLVKASRSKGMPELLIGLYFLGGSLLGYVPVLLFSTLSPDLLKSSPDLVYWLRITYTYGFAFCPAALALFAWWVFRRDSAFAQELAIGAVCLSLGLSIVAAGSPPPTEDVTLLDWVTFGYRIICYGWCGGEALRQYIQGRRRVTLGLANPIVVNRFLLWTIWCVAPIVNVVGSMLGKILALEPASAASTTISAINIIGGFLGGVAIWLTFYSPEIYRRRIGARTTSPGVGA